METVPPREAVLPRRQTPIRQLHPRQHYPLIVRSPGSCLPIFSRLSLEMRHPTRLETQKIASSLPTNVLGVICGSKVYHPLTACSWFKIDPQKL